MRISVIDRDLLMTIPTVEIVNTYGAEYYKQILQFAGQLSRILCDCQDEGIVKKPDDDINMTMRIIRMCCAVPGCNWITITQNPKLAIVKCCGVEMLRCDIIDRNNIITTITEEAFCDEIHLGTVYRLINHLICSFGYTHIKFDMSNVNYQKIYEFIHTYLYQHPSNSDLCRYCAACDTDTATVIFDEHDIPKKELLRIQYTDIGLKLILCSDLKTPLRVNTNWKIKHILPILREFWEYSKYPEPVVTSEEIGYPEKALCDVDAECNAQMQEVLPTAPSFENVDRLVFNGPATIVYWKDGTMTVVKATKGETIDPEKGFAMAALKKVNGNTANYMRKLSKLFKKAEIIESTRKKKTKKKNTDIVATANTPKKTTKKVEPKG
jgi:hypothetical protein